MSPNSYLFFCRVCFTKFLNMVSLNVSGPTILAKVSRPSTWQITYSSARTVILRIVL